MFDTGHACQLKFQASMRVCNINHFLFRTTTALAVLFLVACGSTKSSAPPDLSDVPPTACAKHSDCPGAMACVNNKCQAPEKCTSDQQCGSGLVCNPNGKCGEKKECNSDTECCVGQVECSQVCVDGKCVGTLCAQGASELCFIGCHEGTKACENGYWAECDAAKEGPEGCGDKIDNDCNGETDDGCPACSYVAGTPVEQECSTKCGKGTQQCQTDGQWSTCTAPTDCLCEQGQNKSLPCEKCGHQACSCGDDGVFDCGICEGSAFCEPGQQDHSPCGKCGKKTRTCTSECTWTAFGECVDGGVCLPGAKEEQGCGNCGSQERLCNSDCSWAVWGACGEGAGCKQGEKQTKKCEKCGEQISICGPNCDWSGFSECQNMGACNPGETDTQSCDNCGTKKRSCNANCTWGSFGACQGSGPCAPGAVDTKKCGPANDAGLCQFGEQLRTCSGSCQWNAWKSCAGAVYPVDETTEALCGNGVDEDCDGKDYTFPDSYEPNNDCYDCYYLGADPTQKLYVTMDSKTDTTDCFYFKGIDSSWNPLEKIKVKATTQPAGFDIDLYLYNGLNNCVNGGNPLAKVTFKPAAEDEISWGEGVLSSNDTDYYVVVKSYGAHYCYKSYVLEIEGLK